MMSKGYQLHYVDGKLLIHTYMPVRCRICKAGHYFFENHEGQTICVGCRGEEEGRRKRERVS
jgi:hypothetical protein